MISASECTVEPAMLMLPIPQSEYASTNGDHEDERSRQVVAGEPVGEDRLAHPKSTAANAAKAASFIYGTSESTMDLRRIVRAPARDGIAQTT